MDVTNQRANLHATASPLCDAPCVGPATRANSNQPEKINFRKHLYIGSWKIKTLLDVNSQTMTMRALHGYDVDIVRIPGCGSQRIRVSGTNASY